MRRGIPLAQLPLNFRDAVLFARFCKVRYIWIDSLCIMQDSEADWKAEALRMGQAYANSLCNINATSSLDPSGGFFFSRDPDAVQPLLVRPSKNWLQHTDDVLHLCYSPDSWEVNVEKAPLNTRAWVLQERLLAPRQLHCTAEQLFWECRECRASETTPSSYPDDFWQDSATRYTLFQEPSGTFNNIYHSSAVLGDLCRQPLPTLDALSAQTEALSLGQSEETTGHSRQVSSITSHLGRLLSRQPQPLRMPLDLRSRRPEAATRANTNRGTESIQNQRARSIQVQRGKVYEEWGKLVHEYSRRNMTYDTDRLAAIAGIVAIVQAGLDDECLAELWRGQLPYQLLWDDGGLGRRLPDSGKVAPSWS